VIDIGTVLLDESKFLKVQRNGAIFSAIQINNPDGFVLATKEGRVNGKFGDYLIIGIDREKFLCDKEIFEKTYDIID
jgi:hypothetical protein